MRQNRQFGHLRVKEAGVAQEIQNTKGAGSAVASEISLQSSGEREVGGIGSIARVVADECLTALVVRWLAVYRVPLAGTLGLALQ